MFDALFMNKVWRIHGSGKPIYNRDATINEEGLIHKSFKKKLTYFVRKGFQNTNIYLIFSFGLFSFITGALSFHRHKCTQA